MCLKGYDSSFEDVTLSNEEIKIVFSSSKGAKSPSFDNINYRSPGFDDINYHILKPNFHSLLVPLKCIFIVTQEWHISTENEQSWAKHL